MNGYCLADGWSPNKSCTVTLWLRKSPLSMDFVTATHLICDLVLTSRAPAPSRRSRDHARAGQSPRKVDTVASGLLRTNSVSTAVYSRRLNRVGDGVTSAVLPHHRTYGSVYGGSRSPQKTEPYDPAATRVHNDQSRICPPHLRTSFPYRYRTLNLLAFSSNLHASYAIYVHQASVLPTASFRFHLAVDTLAAQLTVPLLGP